MGDEETIEWILVVHRQGPDPVGVSCRDREQVHTRPFEPFEQVARSIEFSKGRLIATSQTTTALILIPASSPLIASLACSVIRSDSPAIHQRTTWVSRRSVRR